MNPRPTRTSYLVALTCGALLQLPAFIVQAQVSKLTSGESDLVAGDATATSPPVTISIDESGNLILRSDDPTALDRLEEIMHNNRPPRKSYDVFELQYARASWVKLNLDEYFEDDDGSNNNPYRFFYYPFDNQQKDKTRQLGDKPKMRFIADNDTRSIVVIGADDVQRSTIKELIDLWDVPELESDIDDSRYTKLVRVKYSRADAIANALKEAYRDLLSANDKTFQQADGGGESKRNDGESGVRAGGGLSFSFKGKLSLGVDTITNSILVSAEGEDLLKVIEDMIVELDEAARPEGNFEVYKLPPGINGKSVQEALKRMLTTPKNQNQDPNAKNQQQQEQNQAAEQAAAAAAAQNAGTSRGSSRSRNR